jgi:hypothetical protein
VVDFNDDFWFSAESGHSNMEQPTEYTVLLIPDESSSCNDTDRSTNSKKLNENGLRITENPLDFIDSVSSLNLKNCSCNQSEPAREKTTVCFTVGYDKIEVTVSDVGALCAISAVFQARFSGRWDLQREMEFPDIEPQIFTVILR